MKKILAVILCVITTLSICACGREVISETAINTEYIPAYDRIETDYEYKYNWMEGEFQLVPIVKQVHYEECFKVQYKAVYSDNSEDTYWKEVDKETYQNALREIGGTENK